LQEYNVDQIERESCIWEVGISGRSCSVSEDGVLRAIEFTSDLTKPSVGHLVSTIKKAMVEPLDEQSAIRKPEFVVFLDTAVLNDTEMEKVSNLLRKLEITVTSLDFLKQNRSELFDIKKTLPLINDVISQDDIPFNKQPPRGCFNCRKEIFGKASQCSACKAVIYCSAECAVLWIN
jgi:hypothetical protein